MIKMTYKVLEKRCVAYDFKTKEEAEEWASENIQEDEDVSWIVRKE